MSFELLILLVGCFAAAFASGMAGFAFGLVAAGILFHFLSPAVVAPIIVFGSLLIQLGTIGVIWPFVRWPVLRPYLIGGVLGTPIGILLLSRIDGAVITLAVGLLLVVYAGWALAGIALRRNLPALRAGPGADVAVGFASGILGGLGGFSGALPAMWGDLKGLRKDEARAIFQPFIVAMQVAAAIGLVAGGFFGWESARMLLVSLPVMVLGGWLGVRAYRLIPAQGFRLVLLSLLFVSGLSLLF